MCEIILEVEYSIKSMIYQMLKFFKRIAYFIPRWSEDRYFDLRDGPLEKLWEGGVGAGEVQKKNSWKGKLREKKFMHAE